MLGAQNSFYSNEPSVLCLIDFSESSENALRAAVQFAHKNKTRITILHPYRLTSQASKKEDLVKLKRDIDQEALRNFEKISHLLDGTDVAFDFRSEVGFLTGRIQENLRKGNITLIVMNQDLAAASCEALSELVPLLQIPLVIIPKGKRISL